MNRAWMIVLASLIFLSVNVWAQATVTIDNGPYTLNPANDLDVNFTYTDPNYIGFATEAFYFWLSDDATFNNGTDVNVSAIGPIDWISTCDENLIVTGMPCSHTFSLAGQSDGNKYIFVEVRDINDVSLDYSDAAQITFDSTAPVITGPSFDTNIISGTWSNAATTMTATCNETPCTLEYRMGSGAFAALPLAGVLFSNENGMLVIQATDAAGNIADTNASPFDLKVDTTAPTFSGGELSLTSYTNDSTPVFTFTASDAGVGLGSGAKAVFQCNSGTPVEKDYALTIDTFDITANGCDTSQGNKVITVKVKDALGNASGDVNKTINYDTTAPGSIDDSDISSSSVDNDSLSLEWPDISDNSGGSGLDKYEVYRTTSDSIPGSPTGTPSGSSYDDSGLAACTTYYYWVKAVDRAGNRSSANDSYDVATTGCTNTNNNSNNNNNNSSGGGGGGGGACEVTFDIPAIVYAGETITAKASGSSYSNGHLRVTPAGKATFSISKIGIAATSWSGPFVIPNSIGTSLKFVFGSDACTASTTRVVKDPATEPTPSAPTTPSNTSSNSGELGEEPVLPEAGTLSFAMDNLLAMITSAGFNADNPQMKIDAENAITEWNIVPTVKMVPVEGEKGKYVLQLIFSMKNTGNKGNVKLVQDIPKTFSTNASEIESSYAMTVLKEDPLVQFELSDLFEGQTIDIVLTTKETFTFGVASSKLEALKSIIVNPPLLFSSGTAKPVANKEAGVDGSSIISGLVGFVGNTGPLVLGFLLIVGLIFVSVRVVRGSVEGSDNPILRSSSGVRNTGRSAPVRTSPVRGNKSWKSGEIRLDD